MFLRESSVWMLMRFLMFFVDAKNLDFTTTVASLETTTAQNEFEIVKNTAVAIDETTTEIIDETTTAVIDTTKNLLDSRNTYELEIQNENVNRLNRRQRRCLLDLFSRIMTDVNVKVSTRPVYGEPQVYVDPELVPVPRVVEVHDTVHVNDQAAWDRVHHDYDVYDDSEKTHNKRPNKGSNRHDEEYDDDDDDDDDDDNDDDEDVKDQKSVCKDLEKWEKKFDKFVELKGDNSAGLPFVPKRNSRMKTPFKIAKNKRYAALKKNILKMKNSKARKRYLVRLTKTFKKVVLGKASVEKHQHRRRQRKNQPH